MKNFLSILFLFTISWTSLYADNYSLRLDGTNDHVVMPTFTMGGSMSIETWVKFDSHVAWAAIFDFGNTNGTSTGNNNILLTQNPSGELLFGVRIGADDSGGSSSEMTAGIGAFPLNEWVHVAITMNGTAGEIGTEFPILRHLFIYIEGYS